MKINISQIKKLREQTGAPVMDIKRALEEAGEVEKKALAILQKKGFERAEKKSGRETGVGRIFAYTHHSGTIASVVVLLCETDFVARTEEFQTLGKEIALQVASMNPKNSKLLLGQEYIREPGKTIDTLVKELIAKTGENIKVGEFRRFKV